LFQRGEGRDCGARLDWGGGSGGFFGGGIFFVLFPLGGGFLCLADSLGLENVEGEGDSDVEPLPADFASDGELEESEAREIGYAQFGSSKFWGATVGASHNLCFSICGERRGSAYEID
jgi:hypothetical protein